jgi:hypothetical protein
MYDVASLEDPPGYPGEARRSVLAAQQILAASLVLAIAGSPSANRIGGQGAEPALQKLSCPERAHRKKSSVWILQVALVGRDVFLPNDSWVQAD